MFVDTPLENKSIDKCFFDNTYLNPSYSNIPSQNNAFIAITNLIISKREQNYDVFGIKMNKLGKESLLISLCSFFDTQIAVSEKRYFRYVNVLNLNSKYFTTQFDSDCLFFVLNDENEFVNDIKGLKKYYINPSALGMTTSNLNLKEYTEELSSLRLNKAQIPYTEHSSYNELIEFAKRLRPKEFIPLNRNYTNCINTRKIDAYVIDSQFSCRRCNRHWWSKEKVK